MHTHTSASSPATPSSPADAEAGAILARARELAHAAEAGSMPPPFLRGMNLGLLCAVEDGEESRLFERAATALGARVTTIVTNISELGAASDDILNTARVFGRLYDGLECQGLAPDLVQRLRRFAGVPVFDGLASPGHGTAALADRLPGDASTQAKRLLILQGALLFALLNHGPSSGSASPEKTP